MLGRDANGDPDLTGSWFPFAAAIRAARINQSRSQSWLVREVKSAALADGERNCGVTRSAVSRWESGEVTPQPQTVRWIAHAYGLNVPELSAAADVQRKQASVRRRHPTMLTLRRSAFTGMDAHLMLRSQLLHQVLAPTGDGVVSSGQAAPSSINCVATDLDEFISQCAANIATCWRLLRGTETTAILVTWLPLLDAAVNRPSEYRRRLAGLAAQGYIIAGLATVLQGRHDLAEWCCKQSHAYSVISTDLNLRVAALKHLATKYQSAGLPILTLRTYEEALPLTPEATPLLRSRICLGLALAYAECGRQYEAERSLALAQDTFPDRPQDDPSYTFSDCNRSSLYHYGGLIRLAFGQATEAWTTFETTMHDECIPLVPERTVIEIVNCQAAAAIVKGELALACDHVEFGVRGAVRLQSAKRLADSAALYQRLVDRWPGEPRVKQLASVFRD
jgi:transcriptional regulator with XRE-family HTH domain